LLVGVLTEACRQRPPSAHRDELLRFLETQAGRSAGFRAWSFNPPPPQITEAACIRLLAELVAECASQLGRERGPSDLWQETDWVWGDDRCSRWLPRLLDLHDIIGEAMPAGSEPLPPVRLHLRVHEQAIVDAERVRRRLSFASGHGDPAAERAAVLSQADALAVSAPMTPETRTSLAKLFSELAEAARKAGDEPTAGRCYRRSADFEDNAEIRALLLETAAQLEFPTAPLLPARDGDDGTLTGREPMLPRRDGDVRRG
jgi:hypothetical protein